MRAASLSAIGTEWRTHWRTGLAAFLAIATSQGALVAASSLYVMPLQQEFGWSRGEIALAFNTTLFVAAVSPFLGRAIDRFGVRWLMVYGIALTACVFIAMAAMNGSLWLYYTLFGLSAVIGLTASGLTCSRVVSEHFVESRGFSLAVARSGLALSGAVMPPLLFAVITQFSWRAGYLTQAVMMLALALPAVWAWIHPLQSSPHRPASKAVPAPLRALLGDRRLWLIFLGAGLGYAPATAVMSQLQPLLVGKGIGGADAAGLVGVAGIASFLGALVTGVLVDRIWAPAVALVFACGSAAGTLLLAMSGTLDGTGATMAVLLIGLGLGAEIDVVAFMVARYFGVRSFSTVYGITVFGIAFSGAMGASLLGVAYDKFGNYDSALYAIAASFLISGLLYLLLGRYPRSDSHG